MIEERLLFRAKIIDSDEWLQGYLFANVDGLHFITPTNNKYIRGNVVDPATIEPVAVKLHKLISKDEKYFNYYCPNCHVHVGDDKYGRIRDCDGRAINEYCSDCGQRLDWSSLIEGEASDGI